MPDLYVNETEKSLTISHNPSSRSWILFAGVISTGAAVAYSTDDFWLWRIAYVMLAGVVAFLCFDNWEVCVFSKEKGVCIMKQTSLIEKLIMFGGGQMHTVQLSDIAYVSVLEEKVMWAGSGYCIRIHLTSGIIMPITEQALLAERSYYDDLARKVQVFLDLPDLPDQPAEAESADDEEDDTLVDVGDDILHEQEAELTESTSQKQEAQLSSTNEKRGEKETSNEDGRASGEAPPTVTTADGSVDQPSVPSTPGGSSEEEGFEKIDRSEAMQVPLARGDSPLEDADAPAVTEEVKKEQ